MWRSGAIDNHGMPVQELFRDSVLQRYDIGAAAPPSVQVVQYFVWTVIFLIFFVLIFRNQTAVFLAWAGDFLRSPSKRTYFDTSSAVRYGLPLSMLILMPVAAYLVYGSLSVEAPYLLILAVIAGYTVLRLLLLAGIAYVSREGELVTSLIRAGFLAFILITFCYCILFVVGIFLPGLQPVLLGPGVMAVTSVFLFFYAVQLLRIFFVFKEPVLLTILYLCALEFLPIAAAIVTVLRY